MAKKCIICDKPAIFQIKDTADYYCQECAEDNFADLGMLVKVEEEAQRLKMLVDAKLQDSEDVNVESNRESSKDSNSESNLVSNPEREEEDV